MRKHSILKNDNGYTLIVVLLVLIVISITGVSLINTSSNTMKTMANERDDQTTYYVAEKALVETKAFIDSAATKAYETTKMEYDRNLTREPENQKDPSYFKDCFYKLLKSNVFSNSISNSCSITQNKDSEKSFDKFTYQEYFGKIPTAVVTVGDENPEDLFDENGKAFTLSAVGNIDGNGKIRTLSQHVEYKITGLDFNPGDPGGGGGYQQITMPLKYSVQVAETLDVKINQNALQISNGVRLATSYSKEKNDVPGTEKKECESPTCEYGVPPFPDLKDIIIDYVEINGVKKNNILYTETYDENIHGKFDGIVVVAKYDKNGNGVEGEIKFNGNAEVNGVLIAPFSNVKYVGNTTLNGAIIAKSFDANNGKINKNNISITYRKKGTIQLPPSGSIGIDIDKKPILEQ